MTEARETTRRAGVASGAASTTTGASATGATGSTTFSTWLDHRFDHRLDDGLDHRRNNGKLDRRLDNLSDGFGEMVAGFPLDQNTLLAHLDLNRPRLAWESAALISLVCLRVSVILVFGSLAVRPAQVVEQLALSCSVSRSAVPCLPTPALASCSSRAACRHFQLGGKLRNSCCAILATLPALLEPVRARLVISSLARSSSMPVISIEFVDRQIGQIVAGLDAAGGQLRRQ